VRRALKTLLPTGAVRWVRRVTGAWKARRDDGIADPGVAAEPHLLEVLADEVQAGPFRGMKLNRQSSWGRMAPYLLGSYELELHPWLERLISRQPPVVIDVGCADGYYAVGMARAVSNAQVYGFDIDPLSRKHCIENAVRNDVADRVEVRSNASQQELDALIVPGSFVLFDCEGCERKLVDPKKIPSLKDATILIELHEFLDPRIYRVISRKFEPTHSSELVSARVRTLSDCFRRDLPLDSDQLVYAMNEQRPTDPGPMRWLLLEPLSRSPE
jgi:SAM-dependent methyltransferase